MKMVLYEKRHAQDGLQVMSRGDVQSLFVFSNCQCSSIRSDVQSLCTNAQSTGRRSERVPLS